MQIHTGGECCMDAAMTQAAINEFDTKDLDIVFLENVGNLVCPAEYDTGATLNVVILSVPEGDDKPLKYPLVFGKSDLVIVSKIDALPYFDFDIDKCREYVGSRNGGAEVIPVSAKTGENMDKLEQWFHVQLGDR